MGDLSRVIGATLPRAIDQPVPKRGKLFLREPLFLKQEIKGIQQNLGIPKGSHPGGRIAK